MPVPSTVGAARAHRSARRPPRRPRRRPARRPRARRRRPGAVALAAGRQLGVGAAVDDPPVLEVGHLVGQGDGRLAVGDDDHGRCRLLGGAQAGQDRGLDGRVHGAGRVVQDEQARAPDDGSGQGDPLPLAAGERRAALPHPGVQTVRQAGDETVDLGQPQRGPDLSSPSASSARVAQGDVAANGVVEEERLLRHQRRVRGHLAAARPHAGRRRRAGRCRWSGRPAGRAAWSGSTCRCRSGRPGPGAAGRDVEVDVVQDGQRAAVGGRGTRSRRLRSRTLARRSGTSSWSP